MSKRLFWPDFVRVASLFLVVLLHVSAPLLYMYGAVSNFYWSVGNFFDSISRMSVNLFFMLSGALLISKKELIHVFYKKRLKRLLFPWLFWGVMLGLVKYFYTGEFVEYGRYRLFVESFISGYWFIHYLLIYYLITPFFWMIQKRGRYVLLLIWSTVMVFSFSGLIQVSSYLGYLGLYVLGGYLRDKDKYTLLGLTMFIIGTLVVYFGTKKLTINHRVFVSTFYEYLSWNVILQSIGGFTFFVGFSKFIKSNVFLKKMVTYLSPRSFGVFLVHFFVLLFFKNFGISAASFHPVLSIPFFTAVVYLVSLLVVNLFVKNIYLKNFV
ncbi:acyltransferase [Patescibacteria group bacterium]